MLLLLLLLLLLLPLPVGLLTPAATSESLSPDRINTLSTNPARGRFEDLLGCSGPCLRAL